MNNTVKVLLNTISLIITIAINGWVSSGAYNGKSVGEISHQYDTLFAPADYAFTIWGVIYFLLIVYVIFQWYQIATRKIFQELEQEGFWFMIANMANTIWIFTWINEAIGFSVLIMLMLLYSLIQLVKRMNLERWDAPVRTIMFVWWPICIYIGWIILATVANIAAYLTYTGWDGSPISPVAWTIILIAIATGIYITLTFKRYMREASIVGIWGLMAIAVKQWEMHISIAYVALGSSVILLITVIYQAFKNLKYTPLFKIQRGEF